MKMKWKIIIGMLLVVCLVMMTLPVMASDGNTVVNGTVPLIIYNVSSSGITYNGATIAWTTNGAATSQVFYDTASHQNIGDYVSYTFINNNPVSAHNVPLTGLTPNKTYYYRVESTATIGGTPVSNEYSFTTLPAPSNLWALG